MLNNLKKDHYYVVTEDFIFTSYQDVHFKENDIVYIIDVYNGSYTFRDRFISYLKVKFIKDFKEYDVEYLWDDLNLLLFKEFKEI